MSNDQEKIDFKYLLDNILKDNVDVVCQQLPAAGMEYDDIDKLDTLIKHSLNSNNEWIRNAGLLAVYHLNFRLEEKNKIERFRYAIIYGLLDNSNIVNATAEEVMDDLKSFKYDLWLDIDTKIRSKPTSV